MNCCRLDVSGRYPVATGDPDAPEATGLPVSTFALLLLVPSAVDHLQLSGFPQQRALYTPVVGRTDLASSEAWTRVAVSP